MRSECASPPRGRMVRRRIACRRIACALWVALATLKSPWHRSAAAGLDYETVADLGGHGRLGRAGDHAPASPVYDSEADDRDGETGYRVAQVVVARVDDGHGEPDRERED